MRILLSTIFLFLALTLSGEKKLVVVSGSTGIRSGQGNNSPVVVTLEKGDFIYCEWTDSEWVKCRALKWENGSQLEGYVLKKTLLSVEALDANSRKGLIEKVLKKQKELSENFRKTVTNNDGLVRKTAVSELEKHSETKYDPILGILPKHFCLSRDASLLQLFFATKLADEGSADETPSYAIGECYICEPAVVLEQIRKIKNEEQQASLYRSIEWGLLNYYYKVDGKNQTENEEYKKLKKRLDDEKKRNKKQK